MRSILLGRVVLASVAVSAVVTTGCNRQSPTEPSHFRQMAFRQSPLQISPNDGPILGATAATIRGSGFSSGATVTVDGIRVDATVVDEYTITLTMPPHADGKVDVSVTRAPGQQPVSLWSGYTYVGPPVITELFPALGSTAGGTLIFITGQRVFAAAKVTVDGIETNFEWDWPDDTVVLSMPAHAAGPVEVIVTDKWGQTASSVFTYASPATFDLSGDWEGWVVGSAS